MLPIETKNINVPLSRYFTLTFSSFSRLRFRTSVINRISKRQLPFIFVVRASSQATKKR